jgi:hypothetical protein
MQEVFIEGLWSKNHTARSRVPLASQGRHVRKIAASPFLGLSL